MKDTQNNSMIFSWKGTPSTGELIPLSLQHVAAMVVGCVTPAIIVAGVCGLSGDDTIILIQSALLISALITFMQLFPIGNHLIGAGLPVIMGVSFAYLPTLISIGGQFNLATIFGSQLVGGAVAIVFGFFVKYLRKLFPPIVTGTVVFTIGLSLYPTAINYMAGGTSSPMYGDPLNWAIAILVLVVVVFLNNFTKGIWKLASILFGIIVGYIVALFFGLVDFSPIADAGWVMIPPLFHFGYEFQPAAIVTMAILYIVNSVQAIGDLSATTLGGMDREPTMKELSGGIVANGLGSMIGSIFGGLPTATYSQNVGIVSTNKVINRKVFALAGAVIAVAGFIPKFAAIFRSIPSCVLGGATVSVFAVITMSGMRLIAQNKLTVRTTNIVGLSVALGVGISQVPACLEMFPQWVQMVFGGSPVVVSTLVAILLNLILPKDESEEAAFEEDNGDLVEADEIQEFGSSKK
ncbi:MAG: uracil-xanthine permease family protein [Eubacteriaceae bacterium]|jgi:xanthine permease